jgi:hypothetical protein
VADVTQLSLVDKTRPGEWNGILADTRAMLDAARSGDWDSAVLLERERQARLAHFFAARPAPHESAWVRRGIEEILESDARLLALCQAGKAEASGGILELHRKAAANRAYERAAAN